jgi:hypothetical protein
MQGHSGRSQPVVGGFPDPSPAGVINDDLLGPDDLVPAVGTDEDGRGFVDPDAEEMTLGAGREGRTADRQEKQENDRDFFNADLLGNRANDPSFWAFSRPGMEAAFSIAGERTPAANRCQQLPGSCQSNMKLSVVHFSL